MFYYIAKNPYDNDKEVLVVVLEKNCELLIAERFKQEGFEHLYICYRKVKQQKVAHAKYLNKKITATGCEGWFYLYDSEKNKVVETPIKGHEKISFMSGFHYWFYDSQLEKIIIKTEYRESYTCGYQDSQTHWTDMEKTFMLSNAGEIEFVE